MSELVEAVSRGERQEECTSTCVCVCMCVPMYRGRSRIFGKELLQWRVQYRPLDAANPNPLSFILFIARGKGIA